MVCAFGLVGLLPSHRLKRTLNELVYKIGFRIMTRSISGTINFYNKEYRPRSGGFCVANHTTPLDIAILSNDCLFSLVRKKKQILNPEFMCKAEAFVFLLQIK